LPHSVAATNAALAAANIPRINSTDLAISTEKSNHTRSQ
jgi:hypothetical protein